MTWKIYRKETVDRTKIRNSHVLRSLCDILFSPKGKEQDRTRESSEIVGRRRRRGSRRGLVLLHTLSSFVSEGQLHYPIPTSLERTPVFVFVYSQTLICSRCSVSLVYDQVQLGGRVFLLWLDSSFVSWTGPHYMWHPGDSFVPVYCY